MPLDACERPGAAREYAAVGESAMALQTCRTSWEIRHVDATTSNLRSVPLGLPSFSLREQGDLKAHGAGRQCAGDLGTFCGNGIGFRNRSLQMQMCDSPHIDRAKNSHPLAQRLILANLPSDPGLYRFTIDVDEVDVAEVKKK